ncbi:type II secretion system protein GspF [Alphaproteobacteria bacterium]|nr:type II secretion system protein GspF [Alphaproteobacteria bacterium]
MRLYRYKVIDGFGRVRMGLCFSEDKCGLLDRLGHGFVVYVLDRRSKIRDHVRTFSLMFFRNLSPLVSAKLDIISALNIVSNLFKDEEKKAIVDHISASISSGVPFSRALAVFDKYFDKLVLKSIEISEETASLQENIQNIIEYLEAKTRFKTKIKTAMMYPMILLFVMLFVVVFWIVYIVPNFVDVFADIGIELPLATKIIMVFRDFLVNKSWILAPVLGALYFVFKLKNINFREILGKIPIFRKHNRDLFVMRFFFSIAIMLKGKVNLVEALECFSNDDNAFNMRRVPETIRSGATLSCALRSVDFFHDHELAIIESGEKSGALWKSFETLANMLRAKIDNNMAKIINLMQPAVIIFIGSLLIFIIYSVLMPLYSNLEFN